MNPARSFGASLVVTLLGLSACTPASRSRESGRCLFNDDCPSGTLCAGRFCRAICHTDRDCAGSDRCRTGDTADVLVCAPPDAPARCDRSSQCSTGFACSTGGLCLPECRTSYDCFVLMGAGATCGAIDHTCRRDVPVTGSDAGDANVASDATGVDATRADAITEGGDAVSIEGGAIDATVIDATVFDATVFDATPDAGLSPIAFTGRVIDFAADDRGVIANAIVTLAGTANSAVTTFDGEFGLDLVYPGPFARFTVTAPADAITGVIYGDTDIVVPVQGLTRVRMHPRLLRGCHVVQTVPATGDTVVTLQQGCPERTGSVAQVNFPTGSLVRADGTTPFTGQLAVDMVPVYVPGAQNPEQAFLGLPGDLTMQTSTGTIGTFAPFGAMEVRLTDADTNAVVQIAAGHTARIQMDVTRAPVASETFGAYSYNFDTGHWVGGTAGTVTTAGGHTVFQASVTHFSWWAAGIAAPVTSCVRGRVVNLGTAVANVDVRALGLDSQGGRFGNTGSDGSFCIDVPAATPIELVALSYSPAGGVTQGYARSTKTATATRVSATCATAAASCSDVGTVDLAAGGGSSGTTPTCVYFLALYDGAAAASPVPAIAQSRVTDADIASGRPTSIELGLPSSEPGADGTVTGGFCVLAPSGVPLQLIDREGVFGPAGRCRATVRLPNGQPIPTHDCAGFGACQDYGRTTFDCPAD